MPGPVHVLDAHAFGCLAPPRRRAVAVLLQSGGRYSVADVSARTFKLAERASDGIGGHARDRIAGGSFAGFCFLHRDNGQLQLGRNGWARCLPL